MKKVQTPKVSIIVATLNRVSQLERLFDSIEKNNYPNLEVIVVDQNNSDFINEIVFKYSKIFTLKHFKSSVYGVSRNKNIGYSVSSGEIITFSDDDSFYSTDCISKMVSLLEEYDVVAGRSWCPIINTRSLIRSPNYSTKINSFNYFNTTIEFTLFWRREVFEKTGTWDENLGVGGTWGSEGGADLIIKCLRENFKMYYDSSIKIYHENQISKNIDKIYSYSRGHGAFLAKSLFLEKNLRFIPYTTQFLIASIVKSLYYTATFNPQKNVYINRIRGLLNGFVTYCKIKIF